MFSIGDVHFGPVYMDALFGFHQLSSSADGERKTWVTRTGAWRLKPAFFMYRRTIPEIAMLPSGRKGALVLGNTSRNGV